MPRYHTALHRPSETGKSTYLSWKSLVSLQIHKRLAAYDCQISKLSLDLYAMPTLKPAKRVAVIGAGPSGAIAVDALAKEKVFDVIKVFERREGPGGCWYVSRLGVFSSSGHTSHQTHSSTLSTHTPSDLNTLPSHS